MIYILDDTTTKDISVPSLSTTRQRAVKRCLASSPDTVGCMLAKAAQADMVVVHLTVAHPQACTDLCRELRRDSHTADIATSVVLHLRDQPESPVETPLTRSKQLFRRASTPYPSQNDIVGSTHHRILRSGPVRLNLDSRQATLDAAPLDLTPSELIILKTLMARQDVAFSRQQLMQLIHQRWVCTTENAVTVMVCHLRRKLGSMGSCIQTVPRFGYRWHYAGASRYHNRSHSRSATNP